MLTERLYIINPEILPEINVFNFDTGIYRQIVIERIIEHGDMDDWCAMIRLYSKRKILHTVRKSEILKKRDKDFAAFFIYSGFLK